MKKITTSDAKKLSSAGANAITSPGENDVNSPQRPLLPTKPEHLNTDVYYGMSFSRLGPDTVIVRSPSGEIVHRLKDDEWTLAHFAYNVVDNPYFNFLPFYQECDHKAQNAELSKKIFIMKMFSTSQHSGAPLRLATMQGIRFLLAKMVEFCSAKNLNLKTLFNSAEHFKSFHSACSIHLRKSLLTLVRTLSKLENTERGFTLDGQILPYIQKDRKLYKAKSKQFPIIPSRILLLKYEQYQSYLTDFLENFPGIQALLKKAGEDPSYGKSSSTRHRVNVQLRSTPGFQPQEHLQSRITFENAVDEHNLNELSKKYNWDRAINVLSFVSCVLHCAKNLIHIFTLMRDHEVKSLSTNCLSPIRGWNNEALYVAGITTKLYGKKKPKMWITTDAILRPIDALEKIQQIMKPHVHNPENYLIVSTSEHPVSNAKAPKASIIPKRSFEEFLPPVLITDEDIGELESIDPLRNWRNDPRYQIGKPWRITSHQFRRTMAVFCAQTGLITLPSLKRLLGHLTKVMTLYYTKGCSAQNYYFNLINPKLAKELKEAAAEADGAMFIREALRSSERLYGMKGRQIMGDRSSGVWLEGTIKQTLESVKHGLAAWTDTPLGGCGSAKPCNHRAHGNYFRCPGCRELIGKKSVMDETRQIMEYDLKQLDPNSMGYRAEKQNLEDFIELCETIIAKSS